MKEQIHRFPVRRILLAMTTMEKIAYRYFYLTHHAGQSLPVLLDSHWKATTNTGLTYMDVTLPTKLLLDEGTDTITLEGKLPDTLTFGSYLRFSVLFQETAILIDGTQRARYGNAHAKWLDYPFENATQALVVPLTEEDQGKTVTFVVSAPSSLQTELDLIRSPMIGNLLSFVLYDTLSLDGNFLIVPFCFFMCIVLLFLLPLMGKKRQEQRPFLPFRLPPLDCLLLLQQHIRRFRPLVLRLQCGVLRCGILHP